MACAMANRLVTVPATPTTRTSRGNAGRAASAVRTASRILSCSVSVGGSVRTALAALPAFPREVRVVGVAGTVTSLFAIAHAIEPYDPSRVHGGWLPAEDVARVRARLFALPVAERRVLPGMQPKRADVLPAGALLFETALAHLGAAGARVSDRGLRWGVLLDRWETLG